MTVKLRCMIIKMSPRGRNTKWKIKNNIRSEAATRQPRTEMMKETANSERVIKKTNTRRLTNC